MAKVETIASPKLARKAEKYIKQNFDPAYYLIWKIGTETGYRITDLTELRYSDFDLDRLEVSIEENKGTKANKARARRAVIMDLKSRYMSRFIARQDFNSLELLDDSKKTDDVLSALNEVLTPSQLKKANTEIGEAVKACKKKVRAIEISQETANIIKQRQMKYAGADNGQLFNRATIASNRSSGRVDDVITRQSCWRVFSKITDFMKDLGKTIRVGCHSLRKIFARTLHDSNDNDISLVMEYIGHATPKQSLDYIGYGREKRKLATSNMHKYQQGLIAI